VVCAAAKDAADTKVQLVTALSCVYSRLCRSELPALCCNTHTHMTCCDSALKVDCECRRCGRVFTFPCKLACPAFFVATALLSLLIALARLWPVAHLAALLHIHTIMRSGPQYPGTRLIVKCPAQSEPPAVLFVCFFASRCPASCLLQLLFNGGYQLTTAATAHHCTMCAFVELFSCQMCIVG
jgi:hypothetical protein